MSHTTQAHVANKSLVAAGAALAKSDSLFEAGTAKAWSIVRESLGDLTKVTYPQYKEARADFLSGYGRSEDAQRKAWSRIMAVAEHECSWTAPKSEGVASAAKVKTAETKAAIVAKHAAFIKSDNTADVLQYAAKLADKKEARIIIEAALSDDQAAIKAKQKAENEAERATRKTVKASLDNLTLEQLLAVEKFINNGCVENVAKVTKSKGPSSVIAAMAKQLS